MLSQHSIRPVDLTRDAHALSNLARRCSQGDDTLRFLLKRKDFMERSRMFAESHVLVAEVDGAIAATATVGLKDTWIDGRFRRVGYVFDRMVAPTQRRLGLGRTLLREQFTLTKGIGALLIYGYVHHRNFASQRLLESEGMVAHSCPIEIYTVVVGRKMETGGDRACNLVNLLGESDGHARFHTGDDDLRALYDFVDPTGASCEAVAGLTDYATVVGVRRRELIFERIPWLWRVSGRFLPWVPRPGVPYRTWSLHHLLGNRTSNIECDRILAGIRGLAACEQIDVIDIPLFANDPSIGLIKRHSINRFGIPPTAVQLYMYGELRDSLLRSRKPLLVSGRDL